MVEGFHCFPYLLLFACPRACPSPCLPLRPASRLAVRQPRTPRLATRPPILLHLPAHPPSSSGNAVLQQRKSGNRIHFHKQPYSFSLLRGVTVSYGLATVSYERVTVFIFRPQSDRIVDCQCVFRLRKTTKSTPTVFIFRGVTVFIFRPHFGHFWPHLFVLLLGDRPRPRFPQCNLRLRGQA